MANAPARRALVVIDVQNEYIDGKFLIEYPDVSISLPNVARAMDAAHRHQVPIVMVQHILPESAPIFARGSRGADVHESIASKPYDHHIEKTLPSCFAGTDFGAWLKANSIDTIAVVGYMTHNCDDSTMRQAMHEGYQVEFLVDAAGSLPYENKAGAGVGQGDPHGGQRGDAIHFCRRGEHRGVDRGAGRRRRVRARQYLRVQPALRGDAF